MTEGKEPKEGPRRTMLEQRKAKGGTWLEQRKAKGGTWLEERFLRKSLSMMASLMRALVLKSLLCFCVVEGREGETLWPDTPCFLLSAS